MTATLPAMAAHDDARYDDARSELAREIASMRAPMQGRLQRLSRRFGLSRIEEDVLCYCLAPDWDARFQHWFGVLQPGVARRRPTVQLLGDLCCETGSGAMTTRALLSPTAPLVREGLVSCSSSGDVPFPARQFVVSEAVADYLAGNARPDAALAGVATIREPRVRLPDGDWFDRHRLVVERLLGPFRREARLPTAYVCGPAGADGDMVAETVAALAGARLMHVDCRAWITSGAFTRESVRALRRDAMLHGCLVQLARCEALADPGAREARGAIDAFLNENEASGIILTGTTPVKRLDLVDTPLLAFELPRPDVTERVDLWRRELERRGWTMDPRALDIVAGGFRFTDGELRRALDIYEDAAAAGHASPVDAAAVTRACRDVSRHTIRKLARRIVPRRTWDDLVLPADSRAQLAEICASAKARRRVHHEWGFDRQLALGEGLIVLFAGPSGVGKTMSAEIVAGDLGLDLFAVDLSCVVSKYIGETEKNLAAVFDEAEITNAVLFFDECDALFGRRTEISDAHDRYANIEVSYLLQRVDQHDGMVILATNLRANLDGAFTRRIRHVVDFPFPEGPDRAAIWRKVFPPQTPMANDVDVEFLARQFKLAGGSIRNIAVNAAFLAASNGGCVGMKHVIHATRRELQKMGKSCTKTEFGQYYAWVRDGGAE